MALTETQGYDELYEGWNLSSSGRTSNTTFISPSTTHLHHSTETLDEYIVQWVLGTMQRARKTFASNLYCT